MVTHFDPWKYGMQMPTYAFISSSLFGCAVIGFLKESLQEMGPLMIAQTTVQKGSI
jgi:hypothetical protein